MIYYIINQYLFTLQRTSKLNEPLNDLQKRTEKWRNCVWNRRIILI